MTGRIRYGVVTRRPTGGGTDERISSTEVCRRLSRDTLYVALYREGCEERLESFVKSVGTVRTMLDGGGRGGWIKRGNGVLCGQCDEKEDRELVCFG